MQQSILFCLIVVKCEKISVEYGVIFLILQQVNALLFNFNLVPRK